MIASLTGSQLAVIVVAALTLLMGLNVVVLGLIAATTANETKRSTAAGLAVGSGLVMLLLMLALAGIASNPQ